MTTAPRFSEARLEGDFRDGVLRAGGISVKLAPTAAGTPDRLVLWPGGRIELVELKTDSGPLRKIQEVWHRRAAALGVDVRVVRGRSGVEDYLADRQQDAELAPTG